MQVLAGSGVLCPLVAALPTAHGVGGADLELVKGVGMLRLEGARFGACVLFAGLGSLNNQVLL
ncbi:protein of unknown function [Alcaligenes faecalis subsp. faecalis]|nr:protein of unknown function [Alcaligenes faecalis subsp. faecalis]